MREILFRGRNKVLGWFYGTGVVEDGENTWILKNKENTAIAFGLESMNVIPETIGQFTGMTDKNGVKIFECDIFSINGKYPKVIKYQENVMAFCCANLADLKNEDWLSIWQQPGEVWWKDFNRDIEVIGNIHDNKNLLE